MRGPKPRKNSVTFMPDALGREEVAELVQEDHRRAARARRSPADDRRRARRAAMTHGDQRATRPTRDPACGRCRLSSAPGSWMSVIAAVCSVMRLAARRIDRAPRRPGPCRSASMTASTRVRRRSHHAGKARLRETSAIAIHGIRPARNASTATSLAALSHAGRRPARPAGLVGEAEARGRSSRSGGSKSSRRERRPSRCAPNGVREPVGVGQGVADRQAHVGHARAGRSWRRR